MSNSSIHSKPSSSFYHGLYLFLGFNACFFLLQCLILFNQSQGFVNQITLPFFIQDEIAATFCIQLALLLLFTLLQSGLYYQLNPLKPWGLEKDRLILAIWMITTILLLAVNGYFFPLSQLSKLLLLPPAAFKGLMLVSAALFLALIYKSFRLQISTLIVLILACPFGIPTLPKSNPPANLNVVLIGIDSLNPSDISLETMPNLYHYLQASQGYTNAISPLARTYPAWMTLLTGVYPKTHHAFYNLMPKTLVKSQLSVIWTLRQQGYFTFFASDDRRFNNLDKEMGFEVVIGPKTGINDIILGTYNDFPLGNLLINSFWGQFLFPYNASNRASAFSYYPKTFDRKIAQALQNRPKGRPAMIAVHFTLPHWPYNWAGSLATPMDDNTSPETSFLLHQQALPLVDKQIARLMKQLKQQHILANSLLIFLSDHGETFYLQGSRPLSEQGYHGRYPKRLADYFARETSTTLDKSAGHGSDLMSPKQYHCLLATQIRRNHHIIQTPKLQESTVSLLDIAPTILEYTHSPIPHKLDGYSLFTGPHPLNRAIFLESEMFPNKALNKREAIALGAKVFRVNSQSGELEVNPQMLKQLDAEKLHGIIQSPWVLALYPGKTQTHVVLQNLEKSDWTDDPDSELFRLGEGNKLLTQIQQFLKD